MSARSFLTVFATTLAIVSAPFIAPPAAQGASCIVPNNGGTAALPPVGCEYITPDDDLVISDGLPAGTEILIDGVMNNFFNQIVNAGGNLGGQIELYDAQLEMPMTGTGALAGFNRFIVMNLSNQSHSGPRVPGNPVQSFASDMFSMQGSIFGDPDFDQLTFTAGTGNGLPSPGHTTLTRLGPPASDFNVDSFFDITYRIDFVGAPGSALSGKSGSTTGTVRMQAGMPVPEPTSSALTLAGVLGIALSNRRRRVLTG